MKREVCATDADCHNVNAKIVLHFVGVRLQFFAKQQRSLRTVDKTSSHELSSKNMQMRKSVAKTK